MKDDELKRARLEALYQNLTLVRGFIQNAYLYKGPLKFGMLLTTREEYEKIEDDIILKIAKEKGLTSFSVN